MGAAAVVSLLGDGLADADADATFLGDGCSDDGGVDRLPPIV